MTKFALLILLAIPTFSFAADDDFDLDAESVSSQKSNIPPIEVSAPRTQSEYFYRPAEGQTAVQLGYGSANAGGKRVAPYSSMIMNQVESRNQSYNFELDRGFANGWSGSIASGYATSDMSTNGQSTGKSNGLQDIQIDGSRVLSFISYRVIAGVHIDYSPAEQALADSSTPGNEFSGRSTGTPYLGIETNVEKALVGGKIWTNIYTHQWTRNTEGGITRIEKEDPATFIQGFYEFPIYKNAKVNVQAKLGQDAHVVDRVGQLVDIYGASAAAYVPVLEDTTIIGTLSAETIDQAANLQTDTQIGLALRKTL